MRRINGIKRALSLTANLRVVLQKSLEKNIKGPITQLFYFFFHFMHFAMQF